MVRIFLIRHGETAGNKENRFRGRMDFPLNKRGVEQAQYLADELKEIKFSEIFSSPLKRAVETAEIINQHQKCHIKISQFLNNAFLGKWEGQLREDIKKKFPNLYQLWLENPEKLNISGMEKIDEVKKRAGNFIKKIAEEFYDANLVKNIAVVSHRAVIKPIIAELIGIKKPFFWKIHMDTAAYSIVEYSKQGKFLLYQLNQNKHLKEFLIEKE